jgi:hypothetical protein
VASMTCHCRVMSLFFGLKVRTVVKPSHVVR